LNFECKFYDKFDLSASNRPNNLGVRPLVGTTFSDADVETAMEADEALTFDPSEVGPDSSDLVNETVNKVIIFLLEGFQI
jgi:hypothetical protein